MNADDQTAALSTYVPGWIRRACRSSLQELGPDAVVKECAVLFLDLVGFSRQTTRLASLGPKGAEELSVILKNTFAPLVDIIEKHGGDIADFIGDGIVALWDNDNLVHDTQSAAFCGLELQRAVKSAANEGVAWFRMRVSVECGDIFYCRIGGTAGRWRYTVVGDPIVAVGAAYRQAEPGEVVVCAKARAILGPLLNHEWIDGQHCKALSVAPPDSISSPREDQALSLEELQRLLPAVVVERAAALEGRWLAEFRNLCVVQVRLNEIRFDHSLLPTLQRWFVEIEKISARLEGNVLHVRMDDKGINSTIVFGLAPLAHEDDALRAVEAALSIYDGLEADGCRASIGVTSGLAFCGEYGGARRRDYSALGTAVNLSSRLMEKAGRGVLCDAVIAAAVEKRVTFSTSTSLNLKGWPRPVAAFRPEGILRPLQLSVTRRTIGRDRERGILREALNRLSRGAGGVVWIEGDAGIGKSTLLLDLTEAARAGNVRTLQGFATAVDRATPHFAWREVLRQLFAQRRGSATRLVAELLSELSEKPQLVTWLPLIEDIMPLGLEPNPVTRAMSGASRAAGLEELVTFFLGTVSSRQPTLVVLDDAQWMDGASFSLARAVARRLPGLLLIVASRSGAESDNADRLLSMQPNVEVVLDGLSKDAVFQIVCQRLGVSTVPFEVAELITNRAAGNPFYCEELTFALLDMGVLQVHQGECRSARDLAGVIPTLPPSIKSVVITRLDVLPSESQLALKVASALGGNFSPDLLQAIYPQRVTVDSMQDLLRSLVAKNMLKESDSGLSRYYEFRHVIFQETVYELLSFSQRRELHTKIATVMEASHEGRLDPLCAQLARHWELAERPDSAIVYLERAAAQALRSYANAEAIGYLRKAMQLSEGHAVSAGPRALAARQTMLGDANHELRDFDQASLHYQNAMKALGHRLPASSAQLAKGIAANALRQAMHRFLTAPTGDETAVDKQRLAHIYERLSEEYFYRNDPTLVLHGTLASLNLAEQSGALPETISGYNGLALGLGMAGMVRVARYYSRRASRLAEEKGDLPEVARAHLVAGVLTSGLGDWTATRRSAHMAGLSFRQLGDRVRLANSLSLTIFDALLHCHVDQAEAALNDLETVIAADPDMSREIHAWRLCARISIDGIKGAVAPAALDELGELCRAGQTLANLLLCKGVMANGQLRTGDMVAARASALDGAALLQECSVVWAAFGVLGAGGVVQTLIAMWQQAARERSQDSGLLQRTAQQAMRRFLHLSRHSPVCWPWALLLRGRTVFLVGAHAAARRHWRRAMRAAEGLDMPHVVGLSCFEIGFNSPQDDPAGADYLSRAEGIFSTLGLSNGFLHARGAVGRQP